MKLASILKAPIRLVDGPLVDRDPRRRELVPRMAQVLIKFNAAGDERGAISVLFDRGYKMVDIVLMVDDARQVAMQEMVTREMSKP